MATVNAVDVIDGNKNQHEINTEQNNLNLAINNFVNPKMFGAVGDGIADDTQAIKDCFNFMIENGATFNDFSESKYLYTTDIFISAPNKKLIINGNCEIVSNTATFTFSGAKTQLGYVASAATKNNKFLELNQNVNLKKNDIIAIHNSRLSSLSSSRTYYYDGEVRVADSISGTTITLQTPLETSYPSGIEDKVWKIEPIILDINGVTFTGNRSFSLKVSFCAYSKFNLNVNNPLNSIQSQSAFFLDRVFYSQVSGGRYIKYGVSGNGTDYGILVSNCQDLLINADYAYGGRHGVAIGGSNDDVAVPCRRIFIEKVLIENDPATTLHAADFHGNSIDSHYKNCEVKGRIALGGRNVSSLGNTLYVPKGEVRPPIWLGEVIGGEICSIGDTIVNTGSCGAIMQWQSSNNILNLKEPLIIRLQDVTAESNPSLGGLIAVSACPVPSQYILDGFNLTGDITGLSRLMTFTRYTYPINPSYVQVTRANFNVPENVSIIAGDDGLPNINKNVFSSTGSNENGTWIKQSDGSMICKQRISTTMPINTAHAGGFKSDNIIWTFPKAFSRFSPTIVAINLDNTCLSVKAQGTTVNQVTLFGMALSSYTSAGIVIDVIAVGRHLA